jgi:hypothetical protein
MTTASIEARPTPSQLRYLKLLAQRTETTFVYPTSRAQASREIERLRCLPAALRVPPTERESGEEPESYATAVCDEEVRGRGCTASWRHKRERNQDAPECKTMLSEKVELARYHLRSGERVLCAERIQGKMCVVDMPAQPGGRRYVVERNVHPDGNAGLKALLADYVAQARDCGRVPMATSALGLEIEADV